VLPSPHTAEEPLVALLRGRRVVALTGAGISTESGIPDYRGPGTLRRARNPIQYREFVSDAAGRRRYWARSVIGWGRFSSARPNPAHQAVATLENAGTLAGVITQNVDGLHHAAGSRRVIELHGALAEVRCLGCGALEDRERVQERLLHLNPGWDRRRAEAAPDGDAELPAALVDGFRVADCERCDGVLKPNVVFFGESVPRATVDAAWALLDEAEVLLVVGSSLAVFSGYRFVRRAGERGLPIAVVNLGPTRGDPLATVRIAARAGELLPRVARILAP
jgi:NAD+-dependent protein deacetylase sirtuin 4